MVGKYFDFFQLIEGNKKNNNFFLSAGKDPTNSNEF